MRELLHVLHKIIIMTAKFDILDKGYVELLDTFGNELTIVNDG